MAELLNIKGLSISYDGKTNALDNVHLDFHTNEFVVVIGPSGSGKSTFIRSINQLVEPTQGSIVFDGDEMAGVNKKELRMMRTKIGMVFQAYNLIERSSVLKNVLNGKLGSLNQWDTIRGKFADEDVKQAIDLLSKLGLQDQVMKRADELSGGQKQRVGIARALMQDPKLLLADEPIASLDPNSSKVVMDGLKQVMVETGITCIVNLHQVEVAKEYATRIVGIRKGKVVFNDRPEKLTSAIAAMIYEGKEEEATQFGMEV